MRVVFKNGVIGWDLGGERNGCFGKQRLLPGCTRGTPSEAELRGKQRMERACHGILFAYDYRQKYALNPRETGMTSRIEPYRVLAHNTSKQSENKIHDDAVARRFGFSGGLVPGVDVMAYMIHLPVAKWGRAFLERGLIEARFVKPVYDGEMADVTGEESDGVLAIEVKSLGRLCAAGSASLPSSAPPVSISDFSEIAAVTERSPVN